MFEKLAWVGAQSESYATRFIQNGCCPDRVTVTGSVKFDGVETCRKNEQTLRLRAVARQAGIGNKSFTFLAGSTQMEEDLIAAKAWQVAVKSNNKVHLILVPRHPSRVGKLTESLDALGVPWILRSSIEDSPTSRTDVAGVARLQTELEQPKSGDSGYAKLSRTERSSTPAVLIVDVIGELSGWWGLADSGFVGGSMGSRGGQSMIEPAGFGVPICFGPNTSNFADTVDELIDNEAAEVVHDGKQLLAFMQWSFQMPHLSVAMGQRAQQIVGRNMGAAERTVCGIFQAIGQPIARNCGDSDGDHSKAA
jgi:3-deoxy-D-manno-octulosonic-acid transferase